MPIGITKLPRRHTKITKERGVAPELDPFQGRLSAAVSMPKGGGPTRGVVWCLGIAGGSSPTKCQTDVLPS